MVLKMKNVNIMGVHQFLGGAGVVTENNIYEKLPKKGSWQKIARLFLMGG